jgi:hypothetical protein
MTFISRRDLLKRAAVIGVAPVARPFQGRDDRGAESPALHEPGVARPFQARDRAREPLETLTAGEMDILDAVVARLIPTDANGPGATEARAAHYIDRALGGALASSRPAYTSGLAALDRYARSSRGAAFTQLSATDQDSVLIDVETEEDILKELKQFMHGRTTLLISHRISTVRAADMIVYLRDGRIVEQGSHDELVARGGAYYELYQRQELAHEVEMLAHSSEGPKPQTTLDRNTNRV